MSIVLRLRNPGVQNPPEFYQEVWLSSLLWPLCHIFCPDFFCLISCVSLHIFVCFLSSQKLKPLICSLSYSFPAILVWFPEGGEASAWAQLPSWTWDSIILILFKCHLFCDAFSMTPEDMLFSLLWILRIFTKSFDRQGNVLDRVAA